MKDTEYINEFKNMKNLTDICREVGVDRGNLVGGRCSYIKEKEVALKCKKEIVRMYNILILGEQEDGN